METFHLKLANQKCLKIIQKTIFERFSTQKVSFILLETFDQFKNCSIVLTLKHLKTIVSQFVYFSQNFKINILVCY